MRELCVPALRLAQGAAREIYSFGIDGKLLHRFAAVSRVGRNDDAAIRGYQRPEVLSHINAIRAYIESDTPMIPNGIVVAFDSRVRFESEGRRRSRRSSTHSGRLIIPLDAKERPGWIVDGQQRAAAIRDARVERFPIFVNAFITEEVAEQRAQFILVNSTKPLPKGLIHELLPATDAPLPLALHKKRLPALLLEHLNYDVDSPLPGRIRTPTSAGGTIKDNSILKMLENSISDGALYSYRFTDHGRPDTQGMLRILKGFWTAVSRVFDEAWDKPPRQSRLTHGLGIISLGFHGCDCRAVRRDRAGPHRLRDASATGRELVRVDWRFVEDRPIRAQVERLPEHTARCANRGRPSVERLPPGVETSQLG